MVEDVLLLHLVRLALGKEQECSLPNRVVWDEVLKLADKQGVAGIAADGLEKMSGQNVQKFSVQGSTGILEVPKLVKLEFAGRVLTHERIYQRHVELMAKLAKIYQKAEFRMMVLKGWGLSLDYPVPSHRPSGDLDIWLFGQQEVADATFAASSSFQDKSFKIDTSHHHHTVFNMEELMVENHYDFINTHAHRSSRRYEKKLKELANRDYSEKEVEGATVYLPCVDFNFLFLLRHMANHFVGKDMTLRQLLDWALFIEHHHEEIDWKGGLAFLEANGLLRFFNLMALISVEQLGFSRDIFHCELKEDELKDRVFSDIIEPEYNKPLGKGALRIMAGKMCRWWSNRWKHQLCYPDSLLSSFVYGMWAKIQKPAHFLH